MRTRFTYLILALATVVTVAAADQNDTARTLLEAARKTEVVDGNLTAAIRQYAAIVENYTKSDRATVADALVRMAGCYQRLGDAEAQKIYERLLREFGDQKDATAEARTRLAALRPAASQTKPAAREIWTGLGNELRGATPSADGRYLSFTDIETGNVAIRDVGAGTNRLLTNTADWVSEYADAAVISPDSRYVAYTWYIHKENKVELRVASIAGAEPVTPRTARRTDLNEGTYKIAWMPDSEQLLIIRSLSDRTSQIGKVTLRDGSFQSIKSLEWRKPNLLSLSPDGRYVAYDAPAGEAGSPLDILVLATDGSRETAVVKNPASDSFPLWSPDGSHLVFLSDRTGSNALWAVPIHDGRPTGPVALIKTDVGPISLLGMTKPGTLHYFEPIAARGNLYITDLDARHDAKPPAPATERVISNNIGPTWSRDGQFLAYYSFRNTSAEVSSGVLVIRSVKTGDERTVPLPTRVTSRFGAGPKWFPDNRSVLVELGDAQGAGFGFYRLALDTGNTELLAHLPRLASSYDLSPDGRTIFYAIITADEYKLMRFDTDGGRETELKKIPVTESGWEVVALAVSPDGMQLATTLFGGVVEVWPTAGGPARELFRPAVPELGTGAMRQALTWTPDQRFVLFVRGGDRLLWKVPALGGDARKAGLSMPGIKSPAVHPDGTRLVFSAAGAQNTSKVWTLDHFLPAPTAKR